MKHRNAPKPSNLLGIIALTMYGMSYNELDAKRAYHVRNEFLMSVEMGEGWMSDLVSGRGFLVGWIRCGA